MREKSIKKLKKAEKLLGQESYPFDKDAQKAQLEKVLLDISKVAKKEGIE